MPTIIPITDFAAPELDIYARLTENQLLNRADPANALFVAESPLVIGRALDAGCTPVSFLMETKHVNGKGAEILARCPADIPVYAAELHTGKRDEPYQHWRHFPFCCGVGDGRGAADCRRQ